mgnify:CR=1 FL=1
MRAEAMLSNAAVVGSQALQSFAHTRCGSRPVKVKGVLWRAVVVSILVVISLADGSTRCLRLISDMWHNSDRSAVLLLNRQGAHATTA